MNGLNSTASYHSVIAEARKYLDRDPSMAAFIVRGLQPTIDAGMDDLAWALCRDDAHATANDVRPMLDAIEKQIKKDENGQE